MAKNLRAKIPEADTLTIFDVNKSSLEKFSQEAVPSKVVVAGSPREVVENAVSRDLFSFALGCCKYNDEPIVLSMI